MSDEKIFGEIEGIFGWIEKKKKEEAKDKGIQEVQQLDATEQIQEFFDFLNLEASREEVKALAELALQKKEENEKKNAENDKKKNEHQEDKYKITHEDLIRVFLVDEKSKEKEKRDLQNAFRILTPNNDEEKINLKRLKEMLELYDKDYKDSVKDIITELQSYGEDEKGYFNYKEFLDNQFRPKK